LFLNIFVMIGIYCQPIMFLVHSGIMEVAVNSLLNYKYPRLVFTLILLTFFHPEWNWMNLQ